MASGFGPFGESTSRQPEAASFSSNTSDNNEAASHFECNICFDLAQDPIVTLCGHLFCWPCLYKWLHVHPEPKECPVCKAVIEEEKLIPLYGRGKASTDPRSKSIPPGVNIPNRPSGQRPETAPRPPPPEPNHLHHHHGFGFMGGFGGLGGFAPTVNTRFGNFTFGFGGLIPSLFNFQAHGFGDPAIYGPSVGFPYGFSNTFHGAHFHAHHHHRRRGGLGNQEIYLKRLFFLVGFLVILALIWN